MLCLARFHCPALSCFALHTAPSISLMVLLLTVCCVLTGCVAAAVCRPPPLAFARSALPCTCFSPSRRSCKLVRHLRVWSDERERRHQGHRRGQKEVSATAVCRPVPAGIVVVHYIWVIVCILVWVIVRILKLVVQGGKKKKTKRRTIMWRSS